MTGSPLTYLRPTVFRVLLALTLSYSVLLEKSAAQETAQLKAEFPGIIEALNSHDISNLIDGVITEVHFKPGQFVEAGEILYSIDPGTYELAVETRRVQTVQAETTLLSAREDLDRIKKLNDRGSASDVQMLKAEVALSLGEALLAHAKAELKAAETDLEDTKIRAPISGIIGRSGVNPGTYVEQGREPLTRVDQMDPVRLSYTGTYVERIQQLGIDDLRVPEEVLNNLTLRIMLSDTWLYAHTTTPDNISSRADGDSGTLTIWAELANPKFLLRPGMRVTVLEEVTTD